MEPVIKIFMEHCTRATVQEVLVPAHDSLELLARNCTKWQAGFLWSEASAAHAAKFQAHAAALDERITNSLEKQVGKHYRQQCNHQGSENYQECPHNASKQL